MEIIAVAVTVVLVSAGRLWFGQMRHLCHSEDHVQGSATTLGKKLEMFYRKLTAKIVFLWSNGPHTFFVAFGCKGLMTTMNRAQFLRLSDVLIHLFLMCCFKTIPACSASPKKSILTLPTGRIRATKLLSPCYMPLSSGKLEVGWWWVRGFCHQRL